MKKERKKKEKKIKRKERKKNKGRKIVPTKKDIGHKNGIVSR